MAPALEAGLEGVDRSLRSVQGALDTALDLSSTDHDRAPFGGPRSVDEATTDLANRLARSALRTRWRPPALTDASLEILQATAATFTPSDPKEWLAMPLRLPISLATLGTQEALRVLAVCQTMPLAQLPEFLDFSVEIFTDLQVYFSLQYPQELAHWQERLERDSRDHKARLELGRTYTKCGLYLEAIGELERLAETPAWRRRAYYESMIARYRAGQFNAAVKDGIACLGLDRSRSRARYWLWLASRKAGGYPEGTPSDLRMEARDGHHPCAVQFRDVACEIGLDKTSGGRGSAVFDATGDGHLDIVFAGAHAGCSLFLNRGDGTFEDASTGSGLDQCVYAFGVAAADYDNNGRTDLYLSSLGFYDGQGKLMRNEGVDDSGRVRFTDVTAQAGLETWGPGFTATWVDYDNDGFLDLFLANNLGGLFDRKSPNRLFHNNGDGTFTDVSESAGIETPWSTIGAAWGDFRNVGLPDLFVSGLGRAQLFRNNGDGTFTETGAAAGIDAPANGSVALVCDIDDDGWLDIVQLTYSRPRDAIFTLRNGQGPSDGSPMRVFRNNRDGTFTNISPDLGISGCWGTMSANAGDFDNDGFVDLFLGNGDPAMDRTEASVLLNNDGSGSFRNVTFTAGLPYTGKGHGVNLADLRGDGLLHLIVASGGLYPGDLLTNSVYRPGRLPGGFLNIRLLGTVSNRDAIGARIVLEAGGREQHRLVSGGSSFGCLPLEQHFGLGRLERAERLTVRWPSGHEQIIDSPPINTTIRVTEAHDGWERVYAAR